MEWLRSFAFPEPDSEQIQLLMERFGKSRWIERSIVTPDPFALVWSDLGRHRMGAVHQIVRALAPRMFDETAKRCGQIASVRHMWRLHRATRELRPPALTRHEESGLLAIAATLELDADGLPTRSYAIHKQI